MRSLKEIMDPTSTTCSQCYNSMPYASQGSVCDECAGMNESDPDVSEGGSDPLPVEASDVVEEGVDFEKFMRRILVSEGAGSKVVDVETPQRRYIKKFREFPNNRIKHG